MIVWLIIYLQIVSYSKVDNDSRWVISAPFSPLGGGGVGVKGVAEEVVP